MTSRVPATWRTSHLIDSVLTRPVAAQHGGRGDRSSSDHPITLAVSVIKQVTYMSQRTWPFIQMK